MIINKFKIFCMVTIVVVLNTGCGSVEDEWEQTKTVNTVQAYQEFVKKYPKSVYTKEAINKGDELAWQEADKDKTIKGFNAYLSAYPDGRHKNEMYVQFSKDWFLPAKNTNNLKAAKYKMNPVHISGSGPQKTKKNYKNQFVWMPTEGYKVTGDLKTSLGSLNKKAEFGAWRYVYTNKNKTAIINSSDCIVSGELIIPFNYFLILPEQEGYVNNSFSAKLLTDDSILLNFNTSKNNQLCFLTLNYGLRTIILIKADGTVITTAKGVFTRINKKWRYMPVIK